MSSKEARRHNPLEDDLLATGPLRTKPSKRKSRHEEGNEDKFVDSKASRKILRLAQEQAGEDEEEDAVAKPNTAFDFNSRIEDDDEADDIYEDEDTFGDEDDIVEEIELDPADAETFNKFNPTLRVHLNSHIAGLSTDEDQRENLGGPTEDGDEGQGTDLADLIMRKILEHEAAQAGEGGGMGMGGGPIDEDYELPPKVVEVYTK
jgi:essential nuclear protein 1